MDLTHGVCARNPDTKTFCMPRTLRKSSLTELGSGPRGSKYPIIRYLGFG